MKQMQKSDISALSSVDSLLEQLKEARRYFEEWNASESEDLPDLRQQWLRDKPRDGVSMEILEWRSQDPALLSMPEVKSVKKEIAALKLELQQAEDKLEALETVGSPRDTWERALIDAESTLHGITNGLPVSRLRDHLESMYGTSDFNRLPKEAIVIAKANPEVVRAGMVKFAGRLDSLKDFHTDMELQRSYTAIEAAITGLRKHLAGDKAEK